MAEDNGITGTGKGGISSKERQIVICRKMKKNTATKREVPRSNEIRENNEQQQKKITRQS